MDKANAQNRLIKRERERVAQRIAIGLQALCHIWHAIEPNVQSFIVSFGLARSHSFCFAVFAIASTRNMSVIVCILACNQDSVTIFFLLGK